MEHEVYFCFGPGKERGLQDIFCEKTHAVVSLLSTSRQQYVGDLLGLRNVTLRLVGMRSEMTGMKSTID